MRTHLWAAVIVAGASLVGIARSAERQPNIIFILADDLGYGDVGCYNPNSRISTPNLDRLAAEGMRFTDAHSAATVCTPSRYSLQTGRMCFRTHHRGVFCGVGGPCLIEEGRLTIAQLLKDKGYATAMFGKWHVGLSTFDKDGNRITSGNLAGVKAIDYSRPIPDAPIHRGYDRFFGTACCPTTDFLYAYIDGDRIPVPPTEMVDRAKFPRNPYTLDFRVGMIAPNYKPDEVDLVFLDKARQFMREQTKQHPGKPFFFVHATAGVHFATLPARQFVGATKFGPQGDYIHELDWIVGQIMAELDTLGIAENTLVMFGSDNGPEVGAVVNMRKDYGHDGAHPWRGMKRDDWEGGHRTPFIARWPGHIPAGKTNDQLLSHTDVFATCAAIVDARIPDDAAEDSYNMLPVFLGKQGDKPVRPYLLEEDSGLSIRQGQWKYLDHRGSGGNNYDKNEELAQYKLPEKEPDAPGQLYNLATDPGETTNLYHEHPEIVGKLKKLLDQSVQSGRSR